MRSLLRLLVLIIKDLKKTGYSFIVELHLLIKGHNSVKEDSGFTIFLCN